MKPAAVSRADLIRCLGRQGGSDEMTAVLFGFAREKVDQPLVFTPPEKTETSAPMVNITPREEPRELSTSEPIPRLQFLMAVTATTLATDQPAPPKGIPITDAELAVDWDWQAPSFPPLVRWPRLEPYLRRRLGVVTPGNRLDLRRLMRRLGRGTPLLSLPCFPRTTWACQALLLWDDTAEMQCFSKDAEYLVEHLRKERGKHGLKVVVLKGLPGSRVLSGVPQGTPVLALSAMGQLDGSESTGAAWTALARILKFRGHKFQVLNPCPRDRWQPEIADAWPCAVWDRHPRLPRQGGLHHLGEMAGKNEETAGHLLDLLSPASRIEPPLLREARLRLGHGYDAGTEWDAWHHEECWQAPDCFGFLTGETYDARLGRRSGIAAEQPELVRELGSLIREHHAGCSGAVAVEAELRACLCGSPDEDSLKRVKRFLEKAVHRMRDLATRPGSLEVRNSGLARWFEDMVDRLSPEIRAHPVVTESIARGLALAKHFHGAVRIDWPAGIDRKTATAESTSAIRRLPKPIDFRLVRHKSELILLPPGVEHPGFPMAIVRAGRLAIHLTIYPVDSSGGSSSTFHLSGSAEPVSLGSIGEPHAFEIESDRQKIRFTRTPRPPWARRMWYDRYGLAAEFAVAGVPFVMRWIPPGRFLMGSPEGEPGRMKWEGPQHEVTIVEGFWLGETPVTQAQSQAVMGENPSHFKGPLDLPVEQVSWQDCEKYHQRLKELVPGLPFFLPTEKQWEYACRAGTETALYSGGITIAGEHNAPELDPIAWYGGNSGQDLEVTNPIKNAEGEKMQYPAWEFGTHRVKLKQANPWGLYDMLGNVWEWCIDVWEVDAYQKRLDATETLRATEVDENAERVARGGSWSDTARYCRAAIRGRAEPDSRGRNLGLRLAAGQEPEAAEPLSAERLSRRLAEGRSHPRYPA
jgi:formylglycine-generating enzyme required for sulfatase activity